ncbi:MAG TPA: branched-chain amino acid ABC transporter permease [Burkholderiaceae bacterium]|nr:branched-chain amino acid ABC transporter permease [Burkholderiaceae bacterium]
MKALLFKNRFLLLAIATTLVLPLVLSSGSLATEVLIFAIAALGCNLLLGYTGLLSFGQGIFFGVGSYAAGLLAIRAGLPLVAIVPCAVLFGAVSAALVGWLSIRRQGVYFVLLTLAFSQMFYFVAYTLPDWTGGDNGLLGVPRLPLQVFGVTLLPADTAWQYYVIVALIFILTFWFMQRVVDSVFGHTLIAIRENEERTNAVGYDVKQFKIAAFTISGAVTGVAGALYAMMTGIAPLESIEYRTSELILIITVIGGTGNLFGSVIGAAFYVIVADMLSTIWPRWLLMLGVLLMAISLYMQQGLWGVIVKLTGYLRGREGRRHGAVIVKGKP